MRHAKLLSMIVAAILGIGLLGSTFTPVALAQEEEKATLTLTTSSEEAKAHFWEGLYDAQNVLGLFSGPAHEATEEIVEMMDTTFAERVPGAGRRKGTYPGRTSNTISVTVMVSNIGQGSAMGKVEWFYKEATRMMGTTLEKRKYREERWGEVARAADLLPNL